MSLKGKGWLIPIGIVIALIVIIGITMAGNYNKFVNAEETVDQRMSAIDTQLQRRYDLIPNLVNTVKGFASHETEIIREVTSARAALGSARTPDQKAEANAQLESALSRLLVIVENYPNLKSDVHFTQLMDELSGTENRIAVSRTDYNNAVADYNRMIRRFPGSLLAGLTGFDKKDYFNPPAESRVNPEVNFGKDGKSSIQYNDSSVEGEVS